MTVSISSGVADALIALAAANPAAEVCGLLFGEGEVITAYAQAANVAADPACAFEIDPAALIAAHRDSRNGGRGLIGHFHSHPNGLAEPSRTDREMAGGDGMIWAIVAGDRLGLWRATACGLLEEPAVLRD